MNRIVFEALAGLPNGALVLMDQRLLIHGGVVGPGTRHSACRTEVRPVTVAMAAGYGTGVCACFRVREEEMGNG